MPLVLAILAILLPLAVSAIAVLFLRPRALASPGAGYHLWGALLGSSALALIPAGYVLARGNALRWSVAAVLLSESIATLLIAFTIFYLRPRAAAQPSLRPYRLWPLMLASGIIIALVVLLLLDTPIR